MRRQPKHAPGLRRQVVDLYRPEGGAAVRERFPEVPIGTVRRWAAEDRAAAATPTPTAKAAQVAAQTRWGDHRDQVAD